MNKLNIDFEYCYGIKKLVHEFKFRSGKPCSVYAPNGFMKTSFAKTFKDFQKKLDTKDLIFPEKQTLRKITDGSGSNLSPEAVFVIEPYVEKYKAENSSTLLVNSELKEKYEEAVREIDINYQDLHKKLKLESGLTGRGDEPVKIIMESFPSLSNDKYLFLDELVDFVPDDSEIKDVKYNVLFNTKAFAFIESGEVQDLLEGYVSKYNELIESSPILSKKFNHTGAADLSNNLGSNGFFEASHSVNLSIAEGKKEINSAEELSKIIEEEKKRVFEDKDLEKKFDDLDKKLKNAELKNLRDCLTGNPSLLPELKDVHALKKKIWLSYLIKFKSELDVYSKSYRSNKLVIEEVTTQAKAESTDWESVVKIFNERFSVPFRLSVENQEEVILKDQTPEIVFTFCGESIERKVNEDSLLKVLSQGEKRALYILNILFEINARLNEETKTIFIVDDIADSFDYKNKYCIVQFLKDMAEKPFFDFIFLTHNFDFHRTITSRLDIPREQKFIARRNNDGISISQEKYQKNPFIHWKKILGSDSNALIACVPFVRNLAEYCFKEGSEEYLKLTSLLHIKDDTRSITVSDIETIFKKVLIDKQDLDLLDKSSKVLDLIYSQADAALSLDEDNIELEIKVLFAIAIRLKAEEYMISRISDSTFVEGINRNQTIVLIKEFIKRFPSEKIEIELLSQVNLMTPENIHLNSFMFEPILDMSGLHLKKLYEEVSNL